MPTPTREQAAELFANFLTSRFTDGRAASMLSVLVSGLGVDKSDERTFILETAAIHVAAMRKCLASLENAQRRIQALVGETSMPPPSPIVGVDVDAAVDKILSKVAQDPNTPTNPENEK